MKSDFSSSHELERAVKSRWRWWENNSKRMLCMLIKGIHGAARNEMCLPYVFQGNKVLSKVMIKTRVRNWDKKITPPPKNATKAAKPVGRTQKHNGTTGSRQKAWSGDWRPACGQWFDSFCL